MKHLKPTLIIFSLLFSSSLLFAQTKKDAGKADSVENKKSSLKIELGYASNSVFLGRTDSIATPAFSPSLTYTLKSGIYFSGSVSYIPNRQTNKFDGGSIGAGYNFDLGNFSGGVSLEKYFSSFNSTQIISSLNGTAGAELSYNSDFITPSVHAALALGNSGGGTDFILTPGFSHDFEVDKPFSTNDKLTISPAAHLNAGTQNFYSTYFIRKAKRELKLKTNGKGTLSSTSSAAGSGKFQVLDYEFALPIAYQIKKFGFGIVPTYAIAVNKINDSTTQTAYTKNSSVFYLECAISYTF